MSTIPELEPDQTIKPKQGRVWVRLLVILVLWLVQGLVVGSSMNPSQMDYQTFQTYTENIGSFWWGFLIVAYLVAAIRSKDPWYLIAIWTLITAIWQVVVVIGAGMIAGTLIPRGDAIGIVVAAWILMYINLRRARI